MPGESLNRGCPLKGSDVKRMGPADSKGGSTHGVQLPAVVTNDTEGQSEVTETLDLW